MSHSEALLFALPPIPAHFTVTQWIKRWAKLVSEHPVLEESTWSSSCRIGRLI
jgi:hypothetical protein